MPADYASESSSCWIPHEVHGKTVYFERIRDAVVEDEKESDGPIVAKVRLSCALCGLTYIRENLPGVWCAACFWSALSY